LGGRRGRSSLQGNPMTLMPPRKKNWTPGHYQLGVFVRYPDGSVFEVALDKTEEALVQAVAGPIVKRIFLKGDDTKDQGTWDITVNGKAHTVSKPVLSYRDIVELAYGPLEPGARVPVLSMTYSTRRKPGSDTCREGMLIDGQTVDIEAGMDFSAYDTSNA
jgi:hypothetical protein